MDLIRGLLLWAIVAYRKAVSPLLPASCRFYPSCSVFAAEAIEKHGVSRGARLAVARLVRCHPWHPGGIDPVPDKDDITKTGQYRPTSNTIFRARTARR